MEDNRETAGQEDVQETLFARIYEGNIELPKSLGKDVRELSCLSFQEEQQVYLLREEGGRRSILKAAAGSRREFLKAEAAALRKFHFSFTPEIYGGFQENDHFYLWKEYIAGDTLYEKVEREGPLTEGEAGRLMLRLCGMLEQFHKCDPPLIHRDLKPQNIVVTPEENLFLIDLETVREYRQEAGFDTVFVGTRQTAAPEQYGFRQTDCRTDIYALGVICLYLLTECMDAQREGVLELLSPPFREIVKTCTKLDPRERYQNCGELKAAVRVAMSGDIPGKRRKKEKWRRAAAAAAIAAAGVCLFAGWRCWRYYQWKYGEYHFSSELIEQAVRTQLDREEGAITGEDLEYITFLRICGDEIMDGTIPHTSYCGYHAIDGNGVNSFGNIRSVEDCAHMKNLQTLILDRQRITDLSPLKGLPLVSVSLCANEITDIGPLSSCENLRELYLDETQLEDLSPLAGCSQLRTLDICSTGVTDLSPLKETELEALYAIDAQAGGLDALEGLPLKILDLDRVEGAEETAGQISTLERLTIRGYAFPDLEPILGLKNLSQLDLCGGEVESIEGLENFPHLTWLGIEDTKVADLTPLKDCEMLVDLSVLNSGAMEFEPLAACGNLKHLRCDEVQEPAVYKAVPEPWFEVEVLEREEE